MISRHSARYLCPVRATLSSIAISHCQDNPHCCSLHVYNDIRSLEIVLHAYTESIWRDISRTYQHQVRTTHTHPQVSMWGESTRPKDSKYHLTQLPAMSLPKHHVPAKSSVHGPVCKSSEFRLSAPPSGSTALCTQVNNIFGNIAQLAKEA
jgi:hypothetical protein